MAFDNLRLDKGLYASPKGFTASLEAADPSENYKGTALEGLDAYQRQLKRFGIKVSGGIRTAEDAVNYYTIVKETLGSEWLGKDLFRIGASSLVADIERRLGK